MEKYNLYKYFFIYINWFHVRRLGYHYQIEIIDIFFLTN